MSIDPKLVNSAISPVQKSGSETVCKMVKLKMTDSSDKIEVGQTKWRTKIRRRWKLFTSILILRLQNKAKYKAQQKLTNYPCKIRTGILAGSRRDLDGNPAGIAARFWPPGFFLSAGIPAGSRPDSHREAKFSAAKISPRSCRESRRDSRQEAKISAAKISPGSCRESRRDSRWEARIPAAKISPGSYRESRRDSRREATSRRLKSRRDASANLGKILGGQNKVRSSRESRREAKF